METGIPPASQEQNTIYVGHGQVRQVAGLHVLRFEIASSRLEQPPEGPGPPHIFLWAEVQA